MSSLCRLKTPGSRPENSSFALLVPVLALLLAAVLFPGAEEKSADELARELANPNNSLASLTFKNQSFYIFRFFLEA